MRIRLNGEPLELPDGARLADAVREAGAEPEEGARGVAVALDGVVVPRPQWASTPLSEGQAVEVLAAIQGGSEDATDFVGIPSRRDRR
jgi:sulfur carrier protein